ncbi:drug/metabolite transporter (DMT)-like permease [Sinobaca qinghaiensis]|uniref:Drug/metabolite transporter (DMT)-like permease n=1 Tax=Sinobaca qinghaiensis TaxID=342944 RepID=A0A419V4A8_9BACL|nr:DMT family transporter [Sinobaca qinghaiensis]RKD73324.1 drug/metabolite transporter (DMT)-like permease [Sinobaca qinghaiensis]
MKAYIFLIITVIIFTGNILVGKALEDIPPFTIAFLRVGIALAVVLPIGWKQAVRHREVFRSEWKPLLGLALTGVAFFNAFIYLSLKYTSASNVAILESSIPVVTIAASFFLFQERLKGYQWAGVVLSVGGAVWVITDGSMEVIRSLSFNRGDVIMLAAVAVWVIYSFLVKMHMFKFPAYGSLLVMLAAATLVLLPFAAVETILYGLPPIDGYQDAAGIAYLGIFPSVIALLLWNRSIAEIGASQSSVFLNLLPVFTMAGAYIFLGDTITWTQAGGAVVVISGVMLTTRKSIGFRRIKKHNE